MKNKYNDTYTIVSNTRCSNLFKWMLQQLPGLETDIAPEGFENSLYHIRYYPTAEMVYENYRLSRAEKYKYARRMNEPYEVKAMLSFSEFQENFNPQAPDLKREQLSLYIEGIKEIFDHCSLVHDGKLNTYKRAYGLHFENCIYRAAKIIFPEYTTGKCWEFFNVRTWLTVDMKPVYRYVFKQLKEKKLDYRYEVISSKIFDALIGRLESLMVESVVDKILKEPKDLATTDEQCDQTQLQLKEDRKLLEAIMHVPPFVEAYFEVYGRWPENYPPVDG